MGCVYAYVILLTLLGPEYRGRNFDVEADEDMAVAVSSGAKEVHRQDSEDVEKGREMRTA
jgi:SHS family lactate transporter-like MFS transporter